MFFSEFPKQHDYFDTQRKEKEKEERESPDQNRKSKIKNIVILINYICLNLFEQHHCC